MDIYQNARLITSSGNLKKNKGVMLVGVSGNGCQLRVNGLSGSNWVTSTVGLTLTNNPVQIVPVVVYGVTLGTGQLFELN